MTGEIERIAAGLTEAQRAIMAGKTRLVDADEGDLNTLARAGLCWRLSDHFTFDPVCYRAGGWKLRSRGKALRAHLEQHHDKD